MQVVILAGGLGTRLRPLTLGIPKPMVHVGGRPFLEHIVRWVAGQHFHRILLLLGYLGGCVQRYFGDGRQFGVRIDYGWEPKPLGTGGALRNSFDKLQNEFLLLYGDSFLPINYRQVVTHFHRIPSQGLIVVYDNRQANTGVLNNVAMDRSGCVLAYEKGTGAEGLNYVEAGASCLRREVLIEVPFGEMISLEQDIYPKLIGRGELRGMVTRQRFFDIGTPDRLQEFASLAA